MTERYLWKVFLNYTKVQASQALVVHACNPSYLGGKDQKDPSWKPAGQIVLKTLPEKTLYKKGWWSGSRCRPWVQAPVPGGKKKKARL
jgi:hypothetical protein